MNKYQARRCAECGIKSTLVVKHIYSSEGVIELKDWTCLCTGCQDKISKEVDEGIRIEKIIK